MVRLVELPEVPGRCCPHLDIAEGGGGGLEIDRAAEADLRLGRGGEVRVALQRGGGVRGNALSALEVADAGDEEVPAAERGVRGDDRRRPARLGCRPNRYWRRWRSYPQW